MGIKVRFNCGINSAVDRLKRGQVIVYPTNTCYGVGGDAENPITTQRLYRIKQRDFSKPTTILVLNIEMAERYVVFSKTAKMIFEQNSNGILQHPLTFVLPLKENVPDGIKMLSAGTGFLGVRTSNDTISREILQRFKNPITTSSANPKNGFAPYSIKESKDQFRGKKHLPCSYVDGGNLKPNPPSAVIKIEGRGIQVLRESDIPFKQFLAF